MVSNTLITIEETMGKKTVTGPRSSTKSPGNRPSRSKQPHEREMAADAR